MNPDSPRLTLTEDFYEKVSSSRGKPFRYQIGEFVDGAFVQYGWIYFDE